MTAESDNHEQNAIVDVADDVKSMASRLLACHHCDLLHHKVELESGEVARCQRCHSHLYTNRDNSVDRALAIMIAALICYVMANSFPFLTISLSGNTQSVSVLSTVFALSDEGMFTLTTLCFGFILLIPLLRIGGLIYILFPLRFDRHWCGIERVFRYIVLLSPWSMMEIYLLGAVVALVKLATMASIELGLSFWAFVALNGLSVLAMQLVDNHSLWQLISQAKNRSQSGVANWAAGRAGDSQP